MEVKRVACGHCPVQCGLLVYVEDNKVLKIEGDRDHPITQGFICIKGIEAKEYPDHPERLNYPLKRVGERGEGLWKRISWEEAMDEIAEKIRHIRDKFGPEALVHSAGTYHGPDCGIGIRFLNLFGSPNLAEIGIACAGPAMEAEALTYGFGPTMGIPVPGKTKCIVLWGRHPSASAPPSWKAMLSCKEKGAKLIVIDPRLTEEAKKADIWLQLRPGSDGALAMGWLKIIIDEGLYDREFVEEWTIGFDRLKERVKDWNLERVSEITWLEKGIILDSAKLYALNKPGIITFGLACAQIGRNAVQVERAKAILRAITGSLDVEGGTVLSGPPSKALTMVDIELQDKLPERQREKMLGADRFRLHWPGYKWINEAMSRVWYGRKYCLSGLWASCAHPPTVWRAILAGNPYPIKVLIVQYNNTLGCYSNTKLVYKALKSKNLDLLVVQELFMTPTAMLADYLLPGTHFLEKSSLDSNWGWSNKVIASERALDPLYERRNNYDFFKELGIRLGQDDFWPETLEGLWDMMLKPEGITFQELVKRKERWIIPLPSYKKYKKTENGEALGFGTPSGKVEICSSILERLGYDSLPDYEEPGESPLREPELAREYPFILITGGTFIEMHHQGQRQIASLRKTHPFPLVEIHPKTAQALGIEEGNWVYIETKRGRVRQRAKLTEGIDPRVIQADRWWYPEEPGEEPFLHGLWISDINCLTDDDPEKCDPMYGSWQYRALMCKIYKAKDIGGVSLLGHQA